MASFVGRTRAPLGEQSAGGADCCQNGSQELGKFSRIFSVLVWPPPALFLDKLGSIFPALWLRRNRLLEEELDVPVPASFGDDLILLLRLGQQAIVSSALFRLPVAHIPSQLQASSSGTE
mmetsp:Transcript_273/g.922  ORF Transcript_273/g.922 Transcript_273/m.922 type:complete len:120 (-) Transcript_273:1697-2056(-)